jgi:TP901 family phage tail tape measure protein
VLFTKRGLIDMADFANLVLGVDTRGLTKGKSALDDISGASGKAESAFKRAGNSAAGAGVKVSGLGVATKGASSAAIGAAKAFGAMAAAFVSVQTISAALGSARLFNAALAETSTLIEGTPQQLEALTEAARNMSKEFGGSATTQVQAFYQAISAGAGSVEEAASTLDAANRLAIGGATDVTTAVGIMSGVLNSYGKETISAAEVSDALFVGMKAGVTTVADLSASLGTVIPTAKALGISFDEVVAATSALTKNNLTTSVAVTSLNAALVGVIKPTKEASDLAKELGLEFSAAGLQAKGLGGFLADVVEKTGGNVEAMSKLFGSVEALKAALLFAGEAGGQYAEIMAQMDAKTGATAEAFDKMSESLSQRWNVALAAGADILLVFGNALLIVVVPALEAAAAASMFLADNVDVIVPILVGLAATAIPATVLGFVAMTSGITLAGVAAGVAAGAMRLLGAAVAIAGGPWGILAGLVAAAATYFLVFRDNAGEAEAAAYDAQKGTVALNAALGVFSTSAAPSAAKEAIDLANDNYTLADSAYAAAEAELAKAKAVVASYASIASAIVDPNDLEGTFLQGEATAAANRAAIATAALAKAEGDLSTAQKERLSTTKTVMGADTEMAATLGKLNTTVEVITPNIEGAAVAAGGAAKEIKNLSAEIEKLNFDADPLARYNFELAHLNELAANGLTDGAYQKAVADLNEEFANSNPMISKVGDAIGDFVANGMKDFKGLLIAFKNMLKEMIATAIANPIKLALMGGSMSGGAANAATGSLGGLGGLGGIGAGLSSGFMTTGSAFLSGGLSGGFGAISSSIAAAVAPATASIATFATAVGAIALPLLAVAAVFAFFKKKTTALDDGIRITADNFGTLTESFEKLKTTRFFGLSSSISTNFTPLDAHNPISQAVDKMRADTIEVGKILGLTADDFAKFSATMKISTKGMSEEQAKVEIMRQLGILADKFSNVALRRLQEKFGTVIREGETAAQAMVNLADSLTITNAAFADLGFKLFKSSVMGAVAARDFAEAMGGLQQMAQTTSAYYQRFYTEGEQVRSITNKVREALASLGEVMPTTIEGFRALVDQAALLGDTDRVAALINMSGAFAAAIDGQSAMLAAQTEALAARTEALAARMETATTNLQDAFARRMDKLADRAAKSAERLAAAQSNLQDAFARKMEKVADIAAKSAERLAYAQSNLEDAFARKMDKLAEIASKAAQNLAAAQSNLESAFSRKMDKVAARATAAAERLADAQANLESAFSREMTATRETFAASIEALQSTLTDARERLATSRSIADALTAAMSSRLFPDIAGQRRSQDQSANYLRSLVGMSRINDVGALQDALSAVANPSADTYATLEDYRRDFDITSGVIRSLETVAGFALSADEQAVLLLEQQVSDTQAQSDAQLELLQSQLDALLGVSESTQTLASAIRQFNRASEASAALNTDAQLAALQAQLDALLGVDTTVQTLASAIRDFNRAAAANAVASANAEEQTAALQAQLDALLGVDNKVQSLASAIRKFTKAAAADAALNTDAQLAALQSQLDALLGVDTTVQSLADAIRKFTKASAADAALNATAQLAMLQSQLDAMLGIGNNVQSLARAIRRFNKLAAKSETPSYATGTDYHPGGLAYVHRDEMLNLPRGTSVSTTSQTSRMFDNSELLTELRALRNEVSELKASNLSIARSTSRSTSIYQKWDEIGTPGTAFGEVVKTEAA